MVYARCSAGTIPEYGTRLELMCTNPLYVRMPEFEHSGVRWASYVVCTFVLLVLRQCTALHTHNLPQSMSDLAKWIGANTHYVHSYISGTQSVKTESTRTLSNFNFKWTKTLHQNNLNHLTFFLTFFKG